MSIWVTAWCTKALDRLTPGELLAASHEFDFAMLAELWGLPDEVGDAAGDVLRIGPPDDGSAVWPWSGMASTVCPLPFTVVAMNIEL